jgi:hypothetical protein
MLNQTVAVSEISAPLRKKPTPCPRAPVAAWLTDAPVRTTVTAANAILDRTWGLNRT